MVERKNPSLQNALKSRKRAKRKKPDFARHESWRFVKLKENWRRPRGLDNKMRRKIKGWPPTVSAGYKGPKVSCGLHPSGYREVLVHNPGELAAIDPKTQAARVAHTVGKRKRLKIIAKAIEMKIVVLNFKEPSVPTIDEEAEPSQEVTTVEEKEKPSNKKQGTESKEETKLND